jgi:hypothetical protein
MSAELRCYHCSSTVQTSVLQPIGFRDSCPSCARDMHACRNCQHFDQSAHHECREPSAEWVRDKERGNRCEYFTPNSHASARGSSSADTIAALDNLFKK